MKEKLTVDVLNAIEVLKRNKGAFDEVYKWLSNRLTEHYGMLAVATDEVQVRRLQGCIGELSDILSVLASSAELLQDINDNIKRDEASKKAHT